MDRLRVKVKLYEGFKAAERPVEFQLEGQVFGVRAVLDQWFGTDAAYFKLKADDGNVYILKHSLVGEWTLESFRKEDVH